MERRFAVRKREMLAECEVSERVFRGMAERLAEFIEPFAASPATRPAACDATKKHASTTGNHVTACHHCE